MKKALITGITGQDGSYLAEQLLEKGYEVHGLVRRSSSFNTDRLEHIYRDPHEQGVQLRLHFGDLTDSTRLVKLIYELQPDEIYHLGAQSHVRVSFDIPEYTADATAMGTLRLLEAIRETGVSTRFYQASSSEMYGATPPPQNERSEFHPRSPYAVAKVMAYWTAVNYRESYDLFACNGILFNHECLRETTPLMVRQDGTARVATPADLVPLVRKGRSVQQFTPQGLLEVWDGDQWTPVTGITATRRRPKDPDHDLMRIETRAGCVEVTAHHRMIEADGEQQLAMDVDVHDRLALAEQMPPAPEWTSLTAEMAELLGLLVADGYVAAAGTCARFVNNDLSLRARVAELWSKCFLGTSRWREGVSGFNPDVVVHSVELTGAPRATQWLREQLYTRTSLKQVPPLVLNADISAREAFLRGYYAGDGLKRGNGASVKTNSPVLAQGLCWLYCLDGRPASVYAQPRGDKLYFQINLPAPVPVGARGQHLRKDPAEVRRARVLRNATDEWVFDLETESGVFCAGVGRLIVHNSPRRGETFVTRKITRALARINAGLQDKLYLGNLDAKRDWGYAPDYTDAMWRMLQAHEPGDFVIATGEMHSVREFLEAAAGHLGLDWEKHVEFDPRYLRPAEVDALQGDPSKAKHHLGWEPATKFKELVKIMVDADVKQLEDELAGRTVRIGRG